MVMKSSLWVTIGIKDTKVKNIRMHSIQEGQVLFWTIFILAL